MEIPPPDALLAPLSPAMREAAETLRALVRRCVPDAIEGVTPSGRSFGYRVPAGPRRVLLFAWVMPQLEHVHLGFEWGALLDDPHGLLEGAPLVRARWATVHHAGEIEAAALESLTVQAARVTALPAAVRRSLARF
jgi:hypothetical protein